MCQREKLEKIGGVLLALLILLSCYWGERKGEAAPAVPEKASSQVSAVQTAAETEAVPSPLPESAPEEETEPASQPSAKVITVTVSHGNGDKRDYDITTRAETLGEALALEHLIAVEEADFGPYIKTVDRETADPDNEEWWCLTRWGETVTTDVDSTAVEDGETYELTFMVGF